MSGLSAAALLQLRSRLARRVGPVVLRVPAHRADMRLLAEQLADGELLTVEEWAGDRLTLVDAYGRETGIAFLDLPAGQELGAFADAILAVSRGGAVLSPLGRQQAASLPEGTQLGVLTTPA